jgi:hypothetical protein
MTGNLHDGSSNVEAQIQIVNPLLLFDNVDHAANNIGTDVSSSVSLTKQLQQQQQQQRTGSVGSFTKLANFRTIDEEKDEIETVNGDDGDGGESDDIMEPVDSSNESS